jgi:hypothetical protein
MYVGDLACLRQRNEIGATVLPRQGRRRPREQLRQSTVSDGLEDHPLFRTPSLARCHHC